MKSLKFLTKPNPHKQSYSNMMLYLRKQVEERAFSKWGSEKQLDVEFDRRKQKSLAQKESAFKKKLLELRRKTRTALWTGGDKSDHQHEFSTPEAHGEDMYRQTCKICSIVVTFESM